MSIEDVIAAEAEASEGNRDAPLRPGTTVSRGHDRTKTLQVRLNAAELEALSEAAERAGVPTSTLARELILTNLETDPADARTLIHRIQAELTTLATKVG